ncbi:hypothetical protein V6N13_058223 [Hibiscus sabdariffa]
MIRRSSTRVFCIPRSQLWSFDAGDLK